MHMHTHLSINHRVYCPIQFFHPYIPPSFINFILFIISFTYFHGNPIFPLKISLSSFFVFKLLFSVFSNHFFSFLTFFSIILIFIFRGQKRNSCLTPSLFSFFSKVLMRITRNSTFFAGHLPKPSTHSKLSARCKEESRFTTKTASKRRQHIQPKSWVKRKGKSFFLSKFLSTSVDNG